MRLSQLGVVKIFGDPGGQPLKVARLDKRAGFPV